MGDLSDCGPKRTARPLDRVIELARRIAAGPVGHHIHSMGIPAASWSLGVEFGEAEIAIHECSEDSTRLGVAAIVKTLGLSGPHEFECQGRTHASFSGEIEGVRIMLYAYATLARVESAQPASART